MHKPPCREYYPPDYDTLTSKTRTADSTYFGGESRHSSCLCSQTPNLPGTTIKKSFIKNRASSWQLHLQQISPFLIGGEGVWWKFSDNNFHFLDGDDDPSTQGEPGLLHFRHHSILDVQTRRDKCWDKLIRNRVLLPADTIRLYDPDGKLMARLLYQDNEVMYQPCDPHSQAEDNSHD